MIRGKCAEALSHEVDEATGRCYWCGEALEKPYKVRFIPNSRIKSNIELAYGYYFDPNFGLDRRDYYAGDA